mmetsp:Transcript_13409/g.26032  ORF Transcript_13409/g.26032 Transcript_13409/m.26032 type:complete len:82 (-) Transcript_13409:416-661(-)
MFLRKDFSHEIKIDQNPIIKEIEQKNTFGYALPHLFSTGTAVAKGECVFLQRSGEMENILHKSSSFCWRLGSLQLTTLLVR